MRRMGYMYGVLEFVCKLAISGMENGNDSVWLNSYQTVSLF